MNKATRPAPPDQAQRERALHPARSVLVQAPAGSGKTDLLTRRFLRLLAEVDDPAQIVAITFTKDAAAEMRHRILSELEKASTHPDVCESSDPFAMAVLASRALQRSQTLGWNLLDLPAQLRISTIDSFCRELALQQPLLSGLGGGLDIGEDTEALYRRASRRTLQRLAESGAPSNAALQPAIETLLLWRDNNWQELETQLVSMLKQRDRWMQGFVLDREPEEDQLRARLEKPFARAVAEHLQHVSALLGQVPHACEEVIELARFACLHNATQHRELAEFAEFPCGPFDTIEEVEDARRAYLCLDNLLLTASGSFRRTVNVRDGFPPGSNREKQRMMDLIAGLRAVPKLEAALAAVRDLPPARYSDEDWAIVRACFTLLRHAAGELQVVFAEAGKVDFTEVAQLAQRLLLGADGYPTDAALAIADGIRHLLVDEFQDTSRRQHQLIRSLAAAWPDTAGRTLFVVGDPMQSIYFFRDADAELFPRVRELGLELPGAEPLRLDSTPLSANFRTAPELVEALNQAFSRVFAANDGSGIDFSSAQPAREPMRTTQPRFGLHLEFVPQSPRANATSTEAMEERRAIAAARETALQTQTAGIVDLVRAHLPHAERAKARGEKYRIAVLGRTRAALARIAAALRQQQISFRAIDLEPLAGRPEVLDAVALARALFCPEDRISWLGVLRAPWSAMSLADLHTLVSNDDEALLQRPIPTLIAERIGLLSEAGRRGAARILAAIEAHRQLRSADPAAALGTWMEQVWRGLGGAACVDAAGRANLDLLWNALDRLPGGEPDVLSAALATALEKLTAQPDPATQSDCGVQLMTIHKSKGLEFEIVIVPELQARGGRSRAPLLSWLERGLAIADESHEITEFLVAPLQAKGADRGKAKAWVDREIRRRETQEMRRILYVAATRAREELHLFARPAYKTEANGDLALCEPSDSLLLTAWPALEDETRLRFEAWKQSPAETQVEAIAAAAGTLVEMPPPAKPAVLRRLPQNHRASQGTLAPGNSEPQIVGLDTNRLYARHEGGLLSRALGVAVHACMEQIARLRATQEWNAVRAALPLLEPRLIARIRSLGIAPEQAARIAKESIAIALNASHDAQAAWILDPHAHAVSEARWTGVLSGYVRTVQADRVFRAGPDPHTPGENAWWIVDYKTSETVETSELGRLRKLFAPQLETYAQVLRLLHSDNLPIRAGLYYARMRTFDWWEL